MTISSTTNRAIYAGNGVTVAFPFPPQFFANTDLVVSEQVVATGLSTTLALGTDYTVSGAGAPGGGTVTRTVPTAIGTNIVIVRAVPFTQGSSFPNNTAFDGPTVEATYDRGVVLAQQVNDLAVRSIRLDSSESLGLNMILPNSVTRAGKIIAFDGTGAISVAVAAVGTAIALAAQLLTSGGANLIGWLNAGTGAVMRFVQDKLRDQVHIKDYGALCDGTGDDAAAINACIAANPARTIYFSGTPRIKSLIAQGLHQKFKGEGGRGTTNADLPACYLIKDATFVGGVALSIRSPGGCEGMGLLLENGSTGGGVEIIGHGSGVGEMQVVGAGAAGSNGTAYRFGNTAGTNTNSWWADRCLAYGAGILHGFYAHDGSGGAPNVNGGKTSRCEALNVFGDGSRNENANNNTWDTNTEELCTGYACHIVAGSDSIVTGGDHEACTAGQVQIELAASRTVLNLTPDVVVVDLSETTVRLDQYQSKGTDAQFLITGSTTTTKAIAGITRSGNTVSLNIVGHTFIVGDMFAVVGSESGVLQRFTGGYRVASVVDVNNITATVTAARAATLPLTQGSVGALAIVGYAAATAQGWWSYTNGIVSFGGHVINNNVVANALMSGAGVIRGLPLPARTAAGEQCGIEVFFGDGVTFPAATLYPGASIATASYALTIVFGKSGAANVTQAIGAGGVSQTADITFGGSYRAA